MIGETLDGRYEILRKMGGGGMGTVYEARHKGTGRRVALKVITGDFARNPSVLTRFHREAKASGAIETQHIAQVLDTGTDPTSGMPYMVMEYLDGEDLGQVLQRVKALLPDVALRIAAQACIGLQKAHEKNVIHRDIKPGNLFLAKRDDGELVLKLLDFGIAKIKQDRVQQIEASGLTRTGHVLGSPLYMSPEQARGYKDIDQRTDLWSLGIVLYQMLCGRRPHEEIEALGELIIAICSDPPDPVQDVAPWVPPEVAAIVHSALQFDRAERYQSAAAMLDAIKPLLTSGSSLSEDLIAPVSEEVRKTVAPRFDPQTSAAQTIVRPSNPAVVGDGLEATVEGAPLPSSGGMAPGDPSAAEPPTLQAVVPFQSSLSASAPPQPVSASGMPGSGPASPSQAPSIPPAPQTTPSALLAAATPMPPSGPLPVPLEAGAVSGEIPPRSMAPPQRSAMSLVLRAIVALVLSAAGAFGVMHLIRPAPTEVPPAAIVRYTFVVIPEDVSAEVDGRPAMVNGGLLEISGKFGSKHHVRIFKGTREAVGEVIITESGLSPPKLQLPAADPPSGSASEAPQ